MLGTILIFVGVFLIITWFGTMRKMKAEGNWESEGGSGAYLWLVIYIGIIGLGFVV